MIQCYFDGACEPTNPGGNMGYGACIVEGDVETYSYSNFELAHPDNTNNVAEYKALENMLDYLVEQGRSTEEITFMGDSKLVIEQMFGKWKISKGQYVAYARSCKEKLKKFTNARGQWIPREQNQRADDLSKESLMQNK